MSGPSPAISADDTVTSPSPNPVISFFPHLPATDDSILEHINSSFITRSQRSPIYAFLFPPTSTRFIHASRGLVVARLPLAPQHMNSGGSLHGSVGATIVDWIGGLAIASWDLRGATGVSVDINVTYLSGAKVGDVIEIEGKADRVGGNVAFTSVSIFKVEGDGTRGRALVLGRHTKFVGGSSSSSKKPT